MFIKSLLFLILISFGIFKCISTSNFDEEANFTLEWLPLLDPIYDPRDGKCYYQDIPAFKFVIDESVASSRVVGSPVISKPVLAHEKYYLSSARKSNVTPLSIESESSEYENYRTDNFSSKSVNFNHSRHYQSSHCFPTVLLVPKSCRKYKRMWDFYCGPPEDQSSCFGWISRLAYASDMIFDMGLRHSGESFTLIHSQFITKDVLHHLLPNAFFFEFKISIHNLYSNLCEISYLTDKVFKHKILALVFTFDLEEGLKIRILSNESQASLYTAFSKLIPDLISAQPYTINKC